MGKARRRLNISPLLAWKRVILVGFLFWLVMTAIFMLFSYIRLQYLDSVVLYYCGLEQPDPFCVSQVFHALLNAPQYLAVKFVLYFILFVPLLWLLFRNALGRPLWNLGVLGSGVGVLFLATAEPVGIEPFVAMFIAWFTGLLLYRRKSKQVVFNTSEEQVQSQ